MSPLARTLLFFALVGLACTHTAAYWIGVEVSGRVTDDALAAMRGYGDVVALLAPLPERTLTVCEEVDRAFHRAASESEVEP